MIADHPGVNSGIDGGVQAVTRYLVDALCELKSVELHVVRLKRGIERISISEGPGYSLHSIPIGNLGTLTGYRRDQALVDFHLDTEIRPDIVHSQGSGHYGLLAKRSRYPSIVTIHGILAQEVKFQTNLTGRLRTRIQGWLGDRYCIRRASHTILISPYVADYYGEVLAGEKYFIPNPVDSSFFDVQRHEVHGKVLFAGRINARKGVKDLIRAVSIVAPLEGLRLVLAGSTSDKKYFDEVSKEVSRLKIGHIVDFRGTLDAHEFRRELSECCCLVLPSYQETAPMVIQEAMASGVPVIASDICGIPYQIDDGETGLLTTPGDTEMLAECISSLLSNSSMRNRLGLAARAKAQRDYQASVVALQTIDVYKQVMQ